MKYCVFANFGTALINNTIFLYFALNFVVVIYLGNLKYTNLKTHKCILSVFHDKWKP